MVINKVPNKRISEKLMEGLKRRHQRIILEMQESTFYRAFHGVGQAKFALWLWFLKSNA